MNSANDMPPQAKANTDTASMNCNEWSSFCKLSAPEAHAILNRVRDGKPAPQHLILNALRATGDLHG